MPSITGSQLWNNDNPQSQLAISTHDAQALTYPPPDGRMVTGSGDKTVRVWNLENEGQEGTSVEHESELYSLAVIHPVISVNILYILCRCDFTPAACLRRIAMSVHTNRYIYNEIPTQVQL